MFYFLLVFVPDFPEFYAQRPWRSLPFDYHWELIDISIPAEADLDQSCCAITRHLLDAVRTFQQTFPDKHHFRTRIIDQIVDYMVAAPESVNSKSLRCTLEVWLS